MNTRLAKKAARVEQSQVDREFGAAMSDARRKRDEKCAKAGTAFRKGLKDLRDARHEAHADAWAEYDTARDEIVLRFADVEKTA